MKVFEKKTTETLEVKKIFCNKCGKEISEQADSISVEKRWGYFSKKDNELHRFDLCEECYDELIRDFKIPVEAQ